jgi:hypothetical protein
MPKSGWKKTMLFFCAIADRMKEKSPKHPASNWEL